jgi:hypothetical protein
MFPTAEEIADAVAARLQDHDPARTVERLVDAAALAEILGVDRSWVYAHAAELGAYRLGDGPKAALRFSPRETLDLMRVKPDAPRPTVPLLPVRGRRSKA